MKTVKPVEIVDTVRDHTLLKHDLENNTEMWFRQPKSFVIVRRGREKCQFWLASTSLEASTLFSALHLRSFEDEKPEKKGCTKFFNNDPSFPSTLPEKTHVLSLVQHIWNMTERSETGEFTPVTMGQIVKLESLLLDLKDMIIHFQDEMRFDPSVKDNTNGLVEAIRAITGLPVRANMYWITQELDFLAVCRSRIPFTNTGK